MISDESMVWDRPELTRFVAWWCVVSFGSFVPLMFYSEYMTGKVVLGQSSCISIFCLFACIVTKDRRLNTVVSIIVSLHAYATGITGMFILGGIQSTGFLSVCIASPVLFTHLFGTLYGRASAIFTICCIVCVAVLDENLPNEALPVWVHAVMFCGVLVLVVAFQDFLIHASRVVAFTPSSRSRQVSVHDVESSPELHCGGAKIIPTVFCGATPTVDSIEQESTNDTVLCLDKRQPMTLVDPTTTVSVNKIPFHLDLSRATLNNPVTSMQSDRDIASTQSDRDIASPRGAWGKKMRERPKTETVHSPLTPLSGGKSVCSACKTPLARYCSETGDLHPPSSFASSKVPEVTFSETTLRKEREGEQPKSSRSRVRANSFTTNINNPSGVKIIKKTFNWKKGDLIGQGGFGTVHIGLNLETGELMAVKNVEFSSKDTNVVSKMKQLQKEIEIMKPLDHTHVVRYFFTERMGNSINIFMEYVPGGSLQKLLKTFGPLSETTVVQYTYQILLGLAHLHGQGIIHRDIKGANVLLTVEGTVKVADFGASAIVETKDQITGVQGTPYWMAPEVISAQGHNWEADIWSLGCTVMEMLTAKPPWHHLKLTQVEVLQWIVGDMDHDPPIKVPENLTLASEMFLLDCLKRQPESRPSARQLIEHHYFTEDAEEASNPHPPDGQNEPVFVQDQGVSPVLNHPRNDSAVSGSICLSPKGKWGGMLLKDSVNVNNCKSPTPSQRASVVSMSSNSQIQSYLDSEAGQWPTLFTKRHSGETSCSEGRKESNSSITARRSPFKVIRVQSNETSTRIPDELDGEVIMSHVEIPQHQNGSPPLAPASTPQFPLMNASGRRRSSTEWADMVRKNDSKLRESLVILTSEDQLLGKKHPLLPNQSPMAPSPSPAE
eukprot:TRINITY_DN5132_c0_g2_i1.p1 TRINITY_DN5132_c0_g2~~TRINITY_DN5132_c0_g2_i1.p1  ORF type:complete len:893 (+),score=179.74 TRINITY_DN5132_c0_g2_i1:42-2720(+)